MERGPISTFDIEMLSLEDGTTMPGTFPTSPSVPEDAPVTGRKDNNGDPGIPRDWCSQFNRLPNELRLSILGHLQKPDLLKLQCNRLLHPLVNELLYSSLTIVLGNKMDYRLIRLFSHTNRGLEHVKCITVVLNLDHGTGATHAWDRLAFILNALPLHQLTHFRVKGHRPLPRLLQQQLWQTQRKLHNVQILPRRALDWKTEFAVEGDAIQLVQELRTAGLGNVQELRIVPDGIETAGVGRTVLSRGKVRHLEIDGRHWKEDCKDDGRSKEGPCQGDHLAQLLFGYVERVPLGVPGKIDGLTTLVLKDVHMDNVDAPWNTYLDLRNLRALELRHCANAGIFLESIVSRVDRPSLTSITFVHTLAGPAEVTLSKLEQLLSLQGGKKPALEKLVIILRNASRMPRADAISTCKSSLRVLVVDVQGPNPGFGANARYDWIYRKESMALIVTSCKRLVELGLALPLVDCQYPDDPRGRDFTERIKLIAGNSELTALNILNFPMEYSGALLRSTASHVQPDDPLLRFAKRIFQNFRDARKGEATTAPGSQTPESVTFGIRERGKLEPRYFVPIQVEAIGRVRHCAALVTLKDMREAGLTVGILDHEKRDFDVFSRRRFHAANEA